jgi:hypothetical protein
MLSMGTLSILVIPPKIVYVEKVRISGIGASKIV